MQKDDTDNKQGISPLGAAVAGAVIGAGVTVAGAVMLKDKKNREKIKNAFLGIKDHTAHQLGEIKKHVEDTAQEKKKDLKEVEKKIKKE
jgi:hypothetical protein